MSNRVKIINSIELAKMHTGSLLKRKNELLACEGSFKLSDQTEEGTLKLIEFKNSESWVQAYNEVKVLLSQREHLPNKTERKKARIARAKNGKSNERRKNT